MAVSRTPAIQNCLLSRRDRLALTSAFLTNTKYTPTARNVEPGSSNPYSTPWKYLHDKYRGNSSVTLQQVASCTIHTLSVPPELVRDRGYLLGKTNHPIPTWTIGFSGYGEGGRKSPSGNEVVERSMARAHHPIPRLHS